MSPDQVTARSGAPSHIGMTVAVKDRLNACRNPYAHLHQPDINLEQVAQSPMLWDPIRFLETCPASDGACAMVVTDEKDASRGRLKPAWVIANAMRSEPTMFAGRDLPSKDLFLNDGLHLNAAGYDIWNETLAPTLQAK